jgi:hypothetical protein
VHYFNKLKCPLRCFCVFIFVAWLCWSMVETLRNLSLREVNYWSFVCGQLVDRVQSRSVTWVLSREKQRLIYAWDLKRDTWAIYMWTAILTLSFKRWSQKALHEARGSKNVSKTSALLINQSNKKCKHKKSILDLSGQVWNGRIRVLLTIVKIQASDLDRECDEQERTFLMQTHTLNLNTNGWRVCQTEI